MEEASNYPPMTQLDPQVPTKPNPSSLNNKARLPYGLQAKHVLSAMNDFVDWLAHVNSPVKSQTVPRLETVLMPANFSSVVGERMCACLPTHCRTIAKNNHHNGHPDLLPAGKFPLNKAQHVQEGIEVKGSRYLKGWQGHNAEDCWLMVFVFDSNRPEDLGETAGMTPKKLIQATPRPFQFLLVACARLNRADWTFSGRSATSRRTITASVNASGYTKMMANWIYRAPGVKP